MKKTKQIRKEYGYLIVDGKYYSTDTEANGRAAFREVPKEKVKKRLELLKEISNHLKKGLNKEAVLMESLSKLDDKYLLHITKNLCKKKCKIKTRRHHCVDMTIGNIIVPIVD